MVPIKSLKNEASYETLVEAGLPRLPENYYYTFFIKQIGEHRGYLYCRIYQLLWGFIPIEKKSCHKWDHNLDDPSQAVYDLEDFVDIGAFTFYRTEFPKPKKSLPSQDPSLARFLNRRLP